MTAKITSFCIGILLLWSSMSSAETSPLRDPSLQRPARTGACGHAREVAAAKRALAEGDREGALHHLQRARGLLAACERNAVNPEPEWESTASARAFADANAEPDGPLPSRSGTVSRSR